MARITAEDLEMLRQSVRARADLIARRRREIDVLRRALWLRQDLVREQCAGAARHTSGGVAATCARACPSGAAPIILTPAALRQMAGGDGDDREPAGPPPRRIEPGALAHAG